MVLHSYNTHNDYVMQLAGFNHLHDEFYGKQVFDMLNELQVCVCVCACARMYGCVWVCVGGKGEGVATLANPDTYHSQSQMLYKLLLCISLCSQAVHEDLVKGFKHCLQKRIQYGEEKVGTVYI